MGTPLRIIDAPEDWEPRRWPPEGAQVGDMWRCPILDIPGRESWAIMLPGRAGVWFTTETAGGTGDLWGVSGTPPNITVSPSINAEPDWHGHITNGELIP